MALLSASLLVSQAFAAEPIPNTYVDISVPQFTDWNDVNTQTVDGITGATPKTFIYPDQATRDADLIDWDNFDPLNPPHYGVGSVAYIKWELDDGSGRSPGLQVVTDDFEFPVNNCIMASGERPFEDGSDSVVPKTCSDDEGSSKRYFLEITEAGETVDLVFDLGTKDIRYKGIKDPADDGGEALEAFREEYGIGRIYRVVQKVINNTDERWVGVRFELGTGVGAGFQPLTFEDDGVAFEMRPLVPREFFEGETGAPDISVWNPERFATVSPKIYDDGSRARFDPGFFDNLAAGFLNPQSIEDGEKSQYIDSGLDLIDNARFGSITGNYFDITADQASGAGILGNAFGYFLTDSLAPTVIARYDDGDPEGESDAIVAWWDGYDWRYGAAGPDAVYGSVDDFSVVLADQLTQWATKILGRNLPGLETDRYSDDLADDISGLNTESFIYIGDQLLDENGDLNLDSITLRVVTNPATAVFGAGGEDPEWSLPGNEAPALESYLPVDGVPVALNDLAVTVATEPVTIDTIANDVLDGQLLDPADVVSVNIVDNGANGSAAINPDSTMTYTADADFTGVDTVTYTVTVNDGGGDVVSNIATVRVRVDPAPVPDAPEAANDTANTFENEAVTLGVLANDSLHNDAPTTVEVEVVDDALNGTTEVDVDNNIVYTPNADFVGYERFTYRVTVDGVESNTALVTIRVDESVVAPDAADDSVSTPQDEAVTIDVLANDSINKDLPTVVGVEIIAGAANGGLGVDGDDNIVYTPDAGFSGSDSFTYRVVVDGIASNTAQVSVNVTAPPPAPIFVSRSSGGGGGCSYNPGGPIDPTLPLILLAGMAGLVVRQKRSALAAEDS